MPTYTVLSEDELDKWREELHSLLFDLKDNVSYSSLAYFILEVFEYMQINAFYELNKSMSNDGLFVDIKISYKSLKSLFKDEKDFYIINKFKEIADNLRHNGYSKSLLKIFIKDILLNNREACKSVLSISLSGLPTIINFLCSDDLFSVYKELYDKDNQVSYCKNIIYEFCNGDTIITKDIFSHVKSITGFSNRFISSIILDVLSNSSVFINYK